MHLKSPSRRQLHHGRAVGFEEDARDGHLDAVGEDLSVAGRLPEHPEAIADVDVLAHVRATVERPPRIAPGVELQGEHLARDRGVEHEQLQDVHLRLPLADGLDALLKDAEVVEGDAVTLLGALLALALRGIGRVRRGKRRVTTPPSGRAENPRGAYRAANRRG